MYNVIAVQILQGKLSLQYTHCVTVLQMLITDNWDKKS